MIVVKAERRDIGETRRARCEAQIFADMSGVDQCVAIAAIRVAPGVASEDVGQKQCGLRVLDLAWILERTTDLA